MTKSYTLLKLLGEGDTSKILSEQTSSPHFEGPFKEKGNFGKIVHGLISTVYRAAAPKPPEQSPGNVWPGENHTF